MKVYACNDFKGHYPVGTSAIVVARNQTRARQLLKDELKVIGLETDDFTLQELPVDKPTVLILNDGDY